MLTEKLYSSLNETIEEIRCHWVEGYQYIFGHYFKINSKKNLKTSQISSMIADSLCSDDHFLLWHKVYQRTESGMFVTKNGKRQMCYLLKEKKYLEPIELWSIIWQSKNGGKEMTQAEIKEYEDNLKRVKVKLGIIQERKPAKKKTNEKHEQFMFEKCLIYTPTGGGKK